MELKPTLWRTCRILANPHRLRMLRCLLVDSPLTVSQIAARMKLAESVASDYLRLLQSRGLIQGERSGRYLLYADRSDPAVSHAAVLLDALRITLAARRTPLQDVMFTLTGFTHPRRVLIVRTLLRGPMAPSALRRATGISGPALSRHIDKLQRRDIIAEKRGFLKVSARGRRLKQALVALAGES